MSGVLFPVQFHLVDMSQFLISGYIPTQLFYSRGYIPTQLFYSRFLVLIFPTWLVWNIAFIFPFSWKWKNHPIWRSHIFQRGRAQPPTSDCYPSYPIIIPLLSISNHIKPYFSEGEVHHQPANFGFFLPWTQWSPGKPPSPRQHRCAFRDQQRLCAGLPRSRALLWQKYVAINVNSGLINHGLLIMFSHGLCWGTTTATWLRRQVHRRVRRAAALP